MTENWTIEGGLYQTTLKNMLLFELKSWIGRLIWNRPVELRTGENLLNLGCGDRKLPGWINADFFCGFRPSTKESRPQWMLDLRYPLNCPDDSMDGVFTEHVIEHLYPNEAMNLLGELFRILKPGSWLRVVVPDLAMYVKYYNHEEQMKEFDEKWETGCEAIWSLTQNWHHHSVWDATFLGKVLKQMGFAQIRQVSFGVGDDKRLIQDSADRQWESLYMEAQKPVSQSR